MWNSSFCRYLPTDSQNTITDQNELVQLLLCKPLLTCTLEMEKSISYIYSRHNLTITKRLLFKSEVTNRFGKAHKLEEGTFSSHHIFKVKPKSIQKLQPLKRGPIKL